ncbi:MAG: type I-MYXAN CRISPR-associated protein Cas6/Cmx6 [Gammaproteobacteria bacterium]|nr:type I-MYXAN CRISPR-associated protein Cas6/Cmx6 [Gammaproteobacteria bacterium]MCP5298554.1 type I-MYXAN CRISPR-associated protein Cas6/Cmx6 [Chromatiaceae bacterium]
MFWQEDDQPKSFEIPDDVVDLVFDIECRELPVDHAHDLAAAIRTHVPKAADDARFGVHNIHLAGSQNGWERPDPKLGQRLILSRRTKLTIRVAKEHSEDVQQALLDAELDVAGCRMKVGRAKSKKLSNQGTIFSRYVVLEDGEADDENAFLRRIVAHLAANGIQIKKALCGRTAEIEGPDGTLQTRSIMLAGLRPEESIRIQQEGIGPLRGMGCGIFIPHKGIDAVKKAEDDS